MADKLNGKQKKAIKEWNRSIPFDFMYLDEINSGECSFKEAWNSNVDWLNDWVNETTNGINTDGCLCREDNCFKCREGE